MRIILINISFIFPIALFAQQQILDSLYVWKTELEYKRMMEKGNEWINEFEKTEQPVIIGEVYSHIALAESKSGYNNSARINYQRAVDFLKRSPTKPYTQLANIYNGLSFVSTKLKHYDQADLYIDSAIYLARNFPVTDSLYTIGRSFNQRGILYYTEKQFQRALRFLLMAEQYHKRFVGNIPAVVGLYQNIGLCYAEIDSFVRAHIALNKSLLLANSHMGIYHPEVGDIHINIGFNAFRQGNYLIAKYHFLVAKKITQIVYGTDSPNLSMINNNLMQTSFKLRDFEFTENILHEYQGTLSDENSPLSLGIKYNLALLANQMFAYEKSQKRILECLFLESKKENEDINLRFRAYTLALSNSAHSSDFDAAEHYAQLLEKIASTNPISFKDSLNWIGNLVYYTINKKDTSAAKYNLKKLESLISTSQAKEQEDSNEIKLQFLILQASYQLLLHEKNQDTKYLEYALIYSKESISLLDYIKLTKSVEVQENYTSFFHIQYDYLLTTLFRKHKETEDLESLNLAFQYMQKGISQDFYTMRSEPLNNDQDSLIQAYKNLSAYIEEKKQLNYERVRSADLSDSNPVKNDVDILDLIKKRAKLFKQIGPNAGLNPIDISAYPDINKVQSNLNNSQVLISFFHGHDSLFSIACTAGRVAIHSMSLKPISLEISKYLKYLKDPFIPVSKDSLGYLGAALYEKILGPFEHLMYDQKKEILLQVDGELSYIPFYTLLTGRINTSLSFREWPYLMKSFTISRIHSISDFLDPKLKSTAKTLYGGFAPDYKNYHLSDMDVVLETDLSHIVRSGYLNLPYAINEISEVRSIIDGDAFTGKEVSKELFMAKAGDYKIIHIGMHGIAEDEKPEYSKLIFASPDSLTTSELLSNEIYKLNLNADLVILGACNTSVGKLRKGQGIKSMAHYFLNSGARSLMMSLWSIPDKSTSKIMINFFKSLKTGKRTADALQYSKLKYLEDNKLTELAHPYFWAGMIHAGQNETINFYTPNLKYSLSILLIALILFICLGKYLLK